MVNLGEKGQPVQIATALVNTEYTLCMGTKRRREEHLNKNPLTWIPQIPGRAAVVRSPCDTQHSSG